MSRSIPWRRTCSDAVSWHQDEALSATIFILREIGPTGFLLKDDAEEKKVRVLLGDRHSCSCSQFTKERDLCKHICWILLKKFRTPRNNPGKCEYCPYHILALTWFSLCLRCVVHGKVPDGLQETSARQIVLSTVTELAIYVFLLLKCTKQLK